MSDTIIRCSGKHRRIQGGPNDGKNIEYLIGKSTEDGTLNMKLRSNVGRVNIALESGVITCSCGNEITWRKDG